MTETENSASGLRRFALAAAVLVAAAAWYFSPNLQDQTRALLEWIQSLGSAAAGVFIAVYIIACVLLIPGSL
ncbi:MAG: hypothetical protein KDD44_12050, partial [Bdellovibrionales bacterium]|nr:hypothetical protein [Bdellovibrionales bacterium]